MHIRRAGQAEQAAAETTAAQVATQQNGVSGDANVAGVRQGLLSPAEGDAGLQAVRALPKRKRGAGKKGGEAEEGGEGAGGLQGVGVKNGPEEEEKEKEEEEEEEEEVEGEEEGEEGGGVGELLMPLVSVQRIGGSRRESVVDVDESEEENGSSEIGHRSNGEEEEGGEAMPGWG